ncbi:energy transducer TonB [Sphingomonas panaciterrae]|uniref:energy transducer TonB n=1 Tax=Sphingomonas panaciterrae TaxID=1462999 RepID=UPI002FF317D1
MAYGTIDRQRLTRERVIGAGAAIIVQLALGYALITGLAVSFPTAVENGLKLFTAEPTPPPPPPPPVPPPPRPTVAPPEGRASAPNLRSRAAPVAAPTPIVVTPPPPPPVVAAPRPYVANDFMSGSADVRGPGTGAGGSGDGFGSGGAGDGDGSGGGSPETAPRFLRGRMSTSDLPEALFVSGFNGTVGVRYLVTTDGRVRDCVVTRSSGNATVDAITCRLIRERFRFRPSLDGDGRPVNAWIVENHSWEVEADTVEETETIRRRRLRW